MIQNDLGVGDLLYLYPDKKPYKIKACNEEFAICTKPFNLQHTCLYTILDWRQGKRNRNNMIFNPYDYMIQDDIEKCLRDLTDSKHICKISHRGIVDIEITKIVRNRKIIFEIEGSEYESL
jgi:hypothetical protein